MQRRNTGYPSAVPAAGGTPTGCAGQRIKLSAGTTLAYHPQPATERAAYILSATNRSGSGKTFCYNSASGGAITTTAHALTAWRATC